MKKSSVLFALVAAGMATSVYAAQPTAFNVQQLVKLNKLHSAAVSNDGKTLVYGVKVVNDKGEGNSDLYQLDLSNKNAKPKQLTSAVGTEHDVSFAPDGKSIYFLASRTGSSQLFQLALNGGEAIAITDLPLDINGYKLSNDGQQVVMNLRVFPECKDLACSKDKFTEEAERKTTGRLYKQLMVRHWDTWEDNARNHLFVNQNHALI